MRASVPVVVATVIVAGAFRQFAQIRPGSEFQITRITKNLIAAPQFGYGGADQTQSNRVNQWFQVEVEFAAMPEATDDLTFKYYILFNGRLLAGEVTHTNVLAGRDNRSVMYISPRTLTRFLGSRPLTANSVQNIAVQIVQRGVVKDEMSLSRATPQWFTALPPVSGFLLNKNETPFASVNWDRYEQIKTASH